MEEPIFVQCQMLIRKPIGKVFEAPTSQANFGLLNRVEG